MDTYRKGVCDGSGTPPDVEDAIVRIREELASVGFDAGAQTIHVHLSAEGITPVPSVSTIWRVLRRRGLVTAQPHKRPRSSWVRFEAALPNERWQSDVTHFRLADGTPVEILNFLDDHPRVVAASRAMRIVRSSDVLRVFRDAASRRGFPASVLTDNGCIYTAWHRGGTNVVESELLARGITHHHSRPYHPQTRGKVERFHQTLKGYLVKQGPADTVEGLQEQIDTSGVVTSRYRSRLCHIGVGRAYKHMPVIMLVDGVDVCILTEEGEGFEPS